MGERRAPQEHAAEGSPDGEPTGAAVAGVDRRTLLRRGGVAALAFPSLSAFLAACGGGSGTSATTAGGGKPPARPTGTLRVANYAEIGSLDPAIALSTDVWVVSSVYEGLLRFDPDFSELQPLLATSWESSDDQREWVFTLREGVTFHDGEPFDAAAVKASWEYVKKQPGLAANLVPEFKEIDVSDPGKIRFVTAQPYGDMLRNATFLRIMSPKLIEQGAKAAAKTMVGTGPYRFAEWAKGRSVTVAANTDYWGDGPYFEQIEFPLMQDVTTRARALQTGNVDVVRALPAQQRAQFTSDDRFVTQDVESWAVTYVIFQCDRIKDARVRQAVAYAIDRDAIVSGAMQGQGTPGVSIAPPGVYGQVTPSTTYTHDPEKAKSLLKAAGPAGTAPLKIVGPPATVGSEDRIGQAVAEQMRDAGFEVDFQVLDLSLIGAQDWYGKASKHDITIGNLFWLTGGPFILSLGIMEAFAKFADPQLTKLMTKMKSLPDGDERLAALSDIQELYAAQLPWLPVVYHKITDAWTSDVKGYVNPRDDFTPPLGDTYRA